MFAEFERDAHAMAERGEAITAASMNTLYKNLIKDYLVKISSLMMKYSMNGREFLISIDHSMYISMQQVIVQQLR